MATDLDWLTGQVRPLADQLGVVLPSQPTPDQQAWLSAIANSSGPDYDRAMVSRLRQGCAQTLDVVSTARADTRNEQVRALADRAAQLIGSHLQALDRLRLAG
jgi:hypothetical protein